MRTSWKVGIVTIALAGAFTLVRSAQAGNFVKTMPQETVGIWNVELQLNQWVDFSQADGWVLLDDITYTINAAPCETTADEVCLFMPVRFSFDIPMLETPDIGIGTRITVLPQPPMFGFFRLTRSYANARYDQHQVFIGDWSAATFVPSTDVEYVDHFAVAWYGEMAGLIVERETWNIGGGENFIHPFAVATADHPLTLAIAAVQMSQSRHYQTPYVVKHQKLHFQNALLGAVNSGTANLKGRVLPFIEGVPPIHIANSSLTVGNAE